MQFDVAVEVGVSWRTTEFLGMAKLASNKVGWARSSAEDVVGYRLRMAPAPAPVTYELPSFDVGDVTEYDFATDADFANTDGVFNLGLTAVDDAGNESDITTLDAVPIDLVAPDAPANFRRL